MVKKKIIAIIQTRLGSSRLPAKALLELNGKTLFNRVVERVKLSKIIDEIWIATSNTPSDDLIEMYGKKMDINVYRGSLENVFERFIEVTKISQPDYFIRVTGDNPLTEPSFIDQAIHAIIEKNADYVKFINIPYGTGIEAVRVSSFLELQNKKLDEYDKEHVTPFFYKNPSSFKIIQIEPDKELRRSDIRLTIDTLEEYIFLYKLITSMEEKSIALDLRNVISFINKQLT